jgi:hypothetical protein
MAWTTNDEVSQIKELFTSGKVDKIVWNYQAGGDSINDYSNTFYLNGEEVTTEGIDVSDYVLDVVDIAEASDGHYLGEFGNVIITLEGDELHVIKDYQTEWNVSEDEVMYVSLNEEQIEVFKKIKSFTVSTYEQVLDEIEFKEDIYITSKIETTITDVIENAIDKADDFLDALSISKDSYIDDYRTILMEDGLEDDNLRFTLHYSTIETRDGNDS